MATKFTSVPDRPPAMAVPLNLSTNAWSVEFTLAQWESLHTFYIPKDESDWLLRRIHTVTTTTARQSWDTLNVPMLVRVLSFALAAMYPSVFMRMRAETEHYTLRLQFPIGKVRASIQPHNTNLLSEFLWSDVLAAQAPAPTVVAARRVHRSIPGGKHE